jgi:7-cyano-7-deazaguanine synthase in queuosine biosynthesis
MKVCAFSGGVDSIAMLIKFLDAGEEIHAHHVYFMTGQGRWEEETKAFEEQRKYLRDKYGIFKCTTSVMDVSNIGFGVWDYPCIMFNLCLIAEGYNQTPNVEVCFAEQAGDGFFDKPIHRRCVNIFNAYFDSIDYGHRPKLCFPISHMTKREIVKSIPKELLDMTFYCWWPVDGQPCGKCIKCKRMEKILNDY